MARAINGRLLPALSALASEQASPTEETMQKCKLFLDYMATEKEMILTYQASDMVLAVNSDALYLSEPGSQSRVGATFSWQVTTICQATMEQYSIYQES